MELVIGLYAVSVVFFIMMLFFTEEGKIPPGMGFFIFLVAAIAFNASWISCKGKARIINQSYGTNYTREDIFWNGDFIEKQLMANNSIVTDSKNSNVNLNIKTDGKGSQVIVAPSK